MSKQLWKILVNILYISVAVLGLSFFGLSENFAYSDTDGKTIDVYSVGNIKIESIENTTVDGAPIRVIIDKEYDGLVIEYQDEVYTMDNGFTFSQTENMSFELNFDEGDGYFYLDRTFEFLSGFKLISLILLAIMIFNAYFLICNIAILKEKENNDTSYIYITLFRHLHNAGTKASLILFATLGILLFMSNLIIDILYFIYSVSDLGVIFGVIIYFVTILGFAMIYELKVNNHIFNFEDNMIKVFKGNKLIFSENLNNVVYKDIMVRDGNNYFFKNYSQLRLTLMSKENLVEGVDLQLNYFGVENFKRITDKLEAAAIEESVNISRNNSDEESNDNKTYTLIAKDVSYVNKKVITAFIILIILVFVIIFLPLVLDMSSMTFIMLTSIVVVMSLVYVFSLAVKKMKPTYFKVENQKIYVDDVSYDANEIVSISMSHPSETSIQGRVFEIKTTMGRKYWVIKGNTLKNTISDNDKEYRMLYSNVKESFSNIFKEK